MEGGWVRSFAVELPKRFRRGGFRSFRFGLFDHLDQISYIALRNRLEEVILPLVNI